MRKITNGSHTAHKHNAAKAVNVAVSGFMMSTQRIDEALTSPSPSFGSDSGRVFSEEAVILKSAADSSPGHPPEDSNGPVDSAIIDFRELRTALPMLPNSRIIRRVFDHAQANYPPFLFNHCLRSWIFAVNIAEKNSLTFDQEVIAVSALLHDLGFTSAIDDPYRFEVNGANAARSFAQNLGIGKTRCQLIWDSIALHTNPSIGIHKQIDVALAIRGVGVEFGREDFNSFSKTELSAILKAVPRLQMKENFKQCVCMLANQQGEKNYDNYVRAFGERFVPGYHAPSIVDFMMNAPFEE